MSRVCRILTSLIVIVTFTVFVAVVQPQPAQAGSSSTTTILIVLGSVMGGLALFALIMTLVVRNNPAWMPLAQGPDLHQYDKFRGPPDGGMKFGPRCGIQGGALPLLCW